MKKIKIFSFVLALGLFSAYAFNKNVPEGIKSISKKADTSTTEEFKDGDLIFQVNTAGQGLAIQLATHSQYTHIGLLFKEDGEWKVYEAVEPVRVVPLKTFAAHGDNGTYVVRRLAGRDSMLTDAKLKLMKEYLKKQLNKHYDIHFGWDDSKLYCSELAWKCYNAAGISIGPLKKLKEFDLSSPIVKQIMFQRYGKNIPYDEKVVSPGDIFNHAGLVSVELKQQ
jgi:hypothetical protein